MNWIVPFVALFLFQLFKLIEGIEQSPTEIIFLPTELWSNDNATVLLRFEAFGKQHDLMLEKNKNLITPNFEVWKHGKYGITKTAHNFAKLSSCYYVFKNSFGSAAVSLCDTGKMHGLVIFENEKFEIRPFDNEESNFHLKHRIKKRSVSSIGVPHIIKKRSFASDQQQQQQYRINLKMNQFRHIPGIRPELTIELAVFLDAAAYRIYHPLVSRDDNKLLDLVLAYVNNVQAIFYHPSLGQPIHLALVRVDLMEHQPKELAYLDGDTDEMVPKVCSYTLDQNPSSDDDPMHWDLALYMTGLDLHNIRRGKSILGIASGLGGICWGLHQCVLAEFGNEDTSVSPGFYSTYVSAHEIGHSLGMDHDGEGDASDCPKNGYIMSSDIDTKETYWSECSKRLVQVLPTRKTCLFDSPTMNYKYDHSRRYSERPGKQWTAKKQCEIYARNSQAYVFNEQDICDKLVCGLPQGSKDILIKTAGLPLDGTKCKPHGSTEAENFECYAGVCTNILMIQRNRSEFLATQAPPPSGWSDWIVGDCMRNCFQNSFGYIQSVRSCLDKSKCQGFEVQDGLCDDTHLCEQQSLNRRDINFLATSYCLLLGSELPIIELDNPQGFISKYDVNIPQSGCTFICKRKNAEFYIEPIKQLHSYQSNKTLVEYVKQFGMVMDGTWCHKDDQNINYYCMRGSCKPNYQRIVRDRNYSRRQRLLRPESKLTSKKLRSDDDSAFDYVKLPEMMEKGSPVF